MKEHKKLKIALVLLLVTILLLQVNNFLVTRANHLASKERESTLKDLRQDYNELNNRYQVAKSLGGVEDQYLVENYMITWQLLGKDKLEDGVTIKLVVGEKAGDSLWTFERKNIHLGELPLYSELSYHEGMFYVAIDGTLYALAAKSGQVLWSLPKVGYSKTAPQVWEEEIYVLGQYEPYLTKVSSSGDLVWSLADERLLGANQILFREDVMQVETLNGSYLLDYEGTISD